MDYQDSQDWRWLWWSLDSTLERQEEEENERSTTPSGHEETSRCEPRWHCKHSSDVSAITRQVPTKICLSFLKCVTTIPRVPETKKSDWQNSQKSQSSFFCLRGRVSSFEGMSSQICILSWLVGNPLRPKLSSFILPTLNSSPISISQIAKSK